MTKTKGADGTVRKTLEEKADVAVAQYRTNNIKAFMARQS